MKKYTLNGFEQSYDIYAEAVNEANRLKRKEIPLGFESEEEAEAYRTGQWAEYFKNTYKPFKTNADAVVYADGSWDKTTGNGAYGIIIFFKSGEIFCESALLEDTAPETYRVTRFDRNGMQSGEPVYRTYADLFKGQAVEEKKHSFVRASHQDGGECESVMRALEICCKEKGLKNIVVAYDCDFVKLRYKKGRKDATSNVPYAYGAFCEALKKEYGIEPEFIKVDSHTDKKGKGQYAVGSETYPHAVYNDLVDAMAKAETLDNPIGRAENFNVVRVMPEEFKTFKEIEVGKTGAAKTLARRLHTRDMLEMVLRTVNIQPVFID